MFDVDAPTLPLRRRPAGGRLPSGLPRRRPAGRLLTAMTLALLGVLGGCDDPCEALQKKVCDDIAYLKANKRHCEMMQEQARRDALPKEYCESILKSIAKK